MTDSPLRHRVRYSIEYKQQVLSEYQYRFSFNQSECAQAHGTDDRQTAIYSFNGHTTPKVKDKMNQLELDWLIIPPGTTSFLQPIDVSINKPLKAKLRNHWEEWIADEDYQFEVFTPSGNRKRPSYQCVVDWVSNSLMTLDELMVKKSFVTCGIIRDKDFELDRLNTRLRQILIEKDDWDQQESVLKAINQDDELNHKFVLFFILLLVLT